jgi:chorismate-pyruvate lyase
MQTRESKDQDTYDLRPDLHDSLRQSHIDPATLSPLQRILLTTDGTLTEILEAYLFEHIRVIKLSEKLVISQQDLPPLEIKSGTEVIERKILLQGKISRKNFIYAESIIVPERLNEKFRDELLKSQVPIGRLWLENKIETFKEIIDSHQEAAWELSNYFKIEKEDRMFSRTYRVFSNHQPMMMITEKFPESYFLKKI